MSDQGPTAPESPTTVTEVPENADTSGMEERTVLVAPKAQRIPNEELKGFLGEVSEEAIAARAEEPVQLAISVPGPNLIRDGWLGIDEAGTPTGATTLLPPDDGETPAFPVRSNAFAAPSDIVTPSGAEIYDMNMQPSPQLSKYSSPSYKRDYAAIAAAKKEADPVSWISSDSVGQAA